MGILELRGFLHLRGGWGLSFGKRPDAPTSNWQYGHELMTNMRFLVKSKEGYVTY